MDFCKVCQSILTPTTKSGQLKFHCDVCAEDFDSKPTDSLRYHQIIKSMEGSNTETKYKVLEEQSVNDLAGNKVAAPCACGMPYQTQIYIDVENQCKRKLVCKCQF